MPRKTASGRRAAKRDRRKSSRRAGLAPFVPLAIGLASYVPALNANIPSTGAGGLALYTCADGLDDTFDCHKQFPTGCSLSQHPAYDAYLNKLKNRVDVAATGPAQSVTIHDFDHLNANTPAELNSKN